MNTNTENKPANRLIKASSPYLLQHAYNPVDWYEWGPEALTKAEQEDKPILVSIGYSACHWCHVMEHQSFEKDDIAAVMNQHFVCIKVDREERPDIDAIYMDAVQHMGIHGGWPLNVFLLPDKRPFYGGTYFQPQQWTHLLGQIATAYTQHRDKLVESAAQFAQQLQRSEEERYKLTEDSMVPPSLEDMHQLYRNLSTRFDKGWGGLDRSPKFPMPSLWAWLMEYSALASQPDAREHLHFTLYKIARGGIYDQAGGGFARYSVDAEWFAPHFEKMLYDNGQLLSLYSHALGHKPDVETAHEYHHVLEGTVQWLQREMTSPEGLFFSALDADSEGEEGKFYTWTWADFTKVLGAEAELAAAYYSLEPYGNWESGVSILFPKMPDIPFCERYDLKLDQLHTKRKAWEAALLEGRSGRVRPGLDDKILTSWNALTITGLVDVALTSDQSLSWVLQAKDMALKAGAALFSVLYNEADGTLCHSYKAGAKQGPAFLDDYALSAKAALKLFSLTWDAKWLKLAEALTTKAQLLFSDDDSPLYYYTAAGQEDLIARKKEVFDNVIPSSNAIFAEVLLTLGQYLGHDGYLETAKSMIGKVVRIIKTDVNYSSQWALLWQRFALPQVEVVVTGPEAAALVQELRQYQGAQAILLSGNDENTSPLLQGRIRADKNQIFICRNRVCHLPVNTVAEALADKSWQKAQ